MRQYTIRWLIALSLLIVRRYDVMALQASVTELVVATSWLPVSYAHDGCYTRQLSHIATCWLLRHHHMVVGLRWFVAHVSDYIINIIIILALSPGDCRR